MRWLFLSCLLVVGVIGSSESIFAEEVPTDQHDESYAEHMKKVFNQEDKESVTRGEAFACAMCQMMVTACKQMSRGKTKVSESYLKSLLVRTCESPMDFGELDPEDAKAACVRVVNENFSYIMDGISVGEDHNYLCSETDPPLCPKEMTNDVFMKRAAQQQKRKAARKEAQEL